MRLNRRLWIIVFCTLLAISFLPGLVGRRGKKAKRVAKAAAKAAAAAKPTASAGTQTQTEATDALNAAKIAKKQRKRPKKEPLISEHIDKPDKRKLLRVGLIDTYYMRPAELNALIQHPDPKLKEEPLFTHVIKKVNFHPHNFETHDDDRLVETSQKVAINKAFTDKLHSAKIQAYLQLDEMTTTVALMLNENNYGQPHCACFINQLVRFAKAAGFDGVHLSILTYHINTQERLDSFHDFVAALSRGGLKFSFGIEASPAQDPVKNPCWSHAIAKTVTKAEFVIMLDPHEYRLDSWVFPPRVGPHRQTSPKPHQLNKEHYLVTESMFYHGLQEYHKRGVNIDKFVLYASHTVIMQDGGHYYTLTQSQYCDTLRHLHADTPDASSDKLVEMDQVPYLHYATGKKVDHHKDKKQKITHNAVTKLNIGLNLYSKLVGHIRPHVHGIATLIDGDYRCGGLKPLSKSALLFRKCMAWHQ